MPHAAAWVMAGALLAGQSPASGPQQERPIGVDFTMSTGETVKVNDAGTTPLTIRFERVTDDSRCPVEARCITAGDASVVISLRVGRSAARVVLHTGATPREATHGGFRVMLVDLAPPPSLARPPLQRDYRATLRVDKSQP